MDRYAHWIKVEILPGIGIWQIRTARRQFVLHMGTKKYIDRIWHQRYDGRYGK